MQEIISNLQDGTIVISDQFDIDAASYSISGTPYFDTIGSEYIISFVNLQNVIRFTKFTYDTIGLTDNRYLENYYRISRNGNQWTEWLDLKRNITEFPTINSTDPLYLDIRWIRAGTSALGTIRLINYEIDGDLERQNVTDSSITINLPAGENIIWHAPYIYKVFKITDTEIISSTGVTSSVDIKYRYSQDNSKTWSDWETFTKENITTLRINPIRFFQIEYSITNNTSSTVNIQDINLIGDFQNVSLDYFKTNLYGIRECCQSNVLGTYDSNGNFIPADNQTGISGSGVGGGQCGAPGSSLPVMTDQDKANLYNPYAQGNALALLNKMSADAEQVFGFKVIYFATDPDKKGQDSTIHEYQLYNVVCDGVVKVAVDGNNFPDNQITMNQFDLSLFESMTVHVTKKQFKEVFGPQRRPSKEDFLYFCDVNRMFQVDHSQQFRSFNNAAIYYKLILKKYTQKANVQASTQMINDTIRNLNKNSTINELMGIENNQDKAATANKDQQITLTRDPIRLEYSAEIEKELIENSSTIISKANYDLSTVGSGLPGVIYKNLDPSLKVSDNIGFQVWFRLNNYVTDDVYNFMTFYDTDNQIGWKANLCNDRITITLNSANYNWDLLGSQTNDVTAFREEDDGGNPIWYCYVLNIDQRNRKINQFIYKRNVEDESDAGSLTSTILQKLYNSPDISITPVEFELPNSNCEIIASDMRATNIRLFVEIIPEEVHNKVLNQYIIRDDSKYLVFADNATVRLILPSFPLFE